MEKRIKPYWLKAQALIKKQFKGFPNTVRIPFTIFIEKVFISGFYAGEDSEKQEKS